MSEYLVDDALADVDPDTVGRFADELQEFVSRVRANLAAKRRGVGIAPGYLRPVAVQLDAEADRRESLDDPTAEAWRSLAESVRLGERVVEIGRCSGVS